MESNIQPPARAVVFDMMVGGYRKEGHAMPVYTGQSVSLKEYIQILKEAEKNGTSWRPPAGKCVDCGEELHSSPISADDTPDNGLDPLRVGAP